MKPADNPPKVIDGVITEVRSIKRAISERHGNDIDRLLASLISQERYWNGNGVKKAMCIEDIAEISEMIEKMAGAASNPNSLMEYQVDITNIWNEISPYLES